MTQTIRFNVELPKCTSCEKYIASNLKHSVISKVDVRRSYGSNAYVECSYDDKVHSAIDRYKLERELKEAVKQLGYKVS